MNRGEFSTIRKHLNKTQKQMAALLGISLKAVHSYEQGWREVPGHVERQMFFLAACGKNRERREKPCWQVRNCAPEQKARCPAWEFDAGRFCWFISGTICGGEMHASWENKMAVCRSCPVFDKMLRLIQQ